MEDGTLVEWEKKPGDPVQRGDVIAVVETQKGAIEVEAFENGVLESYLVEVGTLVPVGTPLAMIKTKLQGGEEQAASMPVKPGPVVPLRTPSTGAQSEQPAEPIEGAARSPARTPNAQPRIKATPAARRLAEETGIELAAIILAKPGAPITLDDVKAYQSDNKRAGKPAVGTATSTGVSGMRSAIAASMARSKREIPHYYLSHTIDVTEVEAYLAEANAQRAPTDRLLMGALYLKAVALAAAKFSEFNGHFLDGAFQPNHSVHPGMAISVRGGGLVAPAIHDVPSLDLNTVMSKMRDLVSRVRAGRFRSAEVADPTITVSSLGERGVDMLLGVIHPPQVAIVGFGAPVLRPWVSDGGVSARRIVSITLAADHRVSDGHRGALFLRAIEAFLIAPEAL